MPLWDDGFNLRVKQPISFTMGPFFINDVQGTATEQATALRPMRRKLRSAR